MKYTGVVLFMFVLTLAPAAVAADAPAEQAPDPKPPRGPQVSKKVGGGFPLLLLEVKQGSITVKFIKPDENGLTRQTLATDPQRTTVLFVESRYREKAANGLTRTVVKRRRGTLAELKPGQTVTVTERDGLATSIVVEPPPAEQDEGGREKKPGPDGQ
jgi:hypothetical protein